MLNKRFTVQTTNTMVTLIYIPCLCFGHFQSLGNEQNYKLDYLTVGILIHFAFNHAINDRFIVGTSCVWDQCMYCKMYQTCTLGHYFNLQL